MSYFTYCIPENCEDSRYQFGTSWDTEDLEYLVEDAAENYHELHDG